MVSPKKRLVQAEDLYQFKLVSQLRLSPDGATVVYAVHRVDRKTEKKYSNLWLASIQGASPETIQFTYGDHSDTQPRWSPDGKSIAFLSNRGDQEKPAQVYLIALRGGEAHPLTSIEGAISEFSWSPDGRQILCSVTKFDPEELERQKDEQKKKLGVVVRHYDRLFYKLDGVGYLPHERNHLWLVDVRTGKARQLTDHPVRDELQPAWSPDGRWIAYLSNISTSPDERPEHIDLFIIPAKGGEPRLVETPAGVKELVSFSPDGKWLAYYGAQGEGLVYKNMSLWIVPVDGSAPARDLLEPYDLHCSPWVLNDIGQPEQISPTWTLDSQRILFQVSLHGSSLLQSIDREGKDLQTIISKGGVVGSFSLDKAHNHLAYFYGKMDDPGQVILRDLNTGKDTQLTSLNHSLLASLDLGTIEEVWFKGPDHNDLQGWILKPPGFSPEKKYPSIMEIHGGPLAQYGAFFMHEFYFLAAQGYVVYFSNPRGGRGYGEAHARANYRCWGGPDYDDLMSWADYLEQQPYIDPERMGVTGGSYGGYMTLWIIGHTRRFRGAVTQRCVSNFVSMWGSSDFNWAFEYEISDKPPFEDLETYWNLSPMKYIGSARTPTLVIHNEMDLRCPIEQGEQAFVALKRLGVDTEMVRFPDEFHGLSRTGRTDRRIARLNHILRWFEKYLK
jgi:dipeptidyl aminopeptidase/acylaminoacyl peptidase